MSVGMVSAAENVSMDSDVNNDKNLVISHENTDVEIIGDGETGSFTDLQADLINNQHDGVVDLARNYKYDSSKDSSSLKDGIRTHFLKEVLRGDKKEIVLDVDLINNIYGYTINRKSKK